MPVHKQPKETVILTPTRENSSRLRKEDFVCRYEGVFGGHHKWLHLTAANRVLVTSREVAVAVRRSPAAEKWLQPGSRTPRMAAEVVFDFLLRRFETEPVQQSSSQVFFKPKSSFHSVDGGCFLTFFAHSRTSTMRTPSCINTFEMGSQKNAAALYCSSTLTRICNRNR